MTKTPPKSRKTERAKKSSAPAKLDRNIKAREENPWPEAPSFIDKVDSNLFPHYFQAMIECREPADWNTADTMVVAQMAADSVRIAKLEAFLAEYGPTDEHGKNRPEAKMALELHRINLSRGRLLGLHAGRANAQRRSGAKAFNEARDKAKSDNIHPFLARS